MAAKPGWYNDPDRKGGKRFWDGTDWTETRPPAPVSRIEVFGQMALLITVVLVVALAAVMIATRP